MMLEKGGGGASELEKKDEKEQTKTAGEHDPLKNTRTARPTITYNRYALLDDGDVSECEDSGSPDDDCQYNPKKFKPNKRQRLRRKQATTTTNDDNNNDDSGT